MPRNSSPAAWSRASTTRPSSPCEKLTDSGPSASLKSPSTMPSAICRSPTPPTDSTDEPFSELANHSAGLFIQKVASGMAVKWPGYGKRNQEAGLRARLSQRRCGTSAKERYGQRREVLFHAPADCPAERAKVMFCECQADIDYGPSSEARGTT